MSGKIRVLYIQAFPGGGSLIALYEMLRNINPLLVEAVVLCYYKNQHTQKLEQLEHCEVLYLPENMIAAHIKEKQFKRYNKLSGFLVAQWHALHQYYRADRQIVDSVYKIIKDVRPHIVHHNNDIRANRADVRAASKAGIPSVLHIRTISFVNNHLVNYFFDKMLMRKVAIRINITNAVKSHYDKLFPPLPGTSIVLHDFVDKGKYYPMPDDAGIRKEFGISKDCLLLANIGRITEWKGQHVLLEAMGLLKNKLPCFKVMLVGSAEKGIGSGSYELYLKRLVMQHGLEDHVIFTGNRDDINEIINASDVVIHTAVQPEPQGLVVIEALLCGKQVIASDAGGTIELIKKYGGILVKPGEAPALSKAILYVLVHENNIGITAYPYDQQKLLHDFNAVSQAERLMDIYRQVSE
jgi:glycosyltransferase involved in cell wall biosynthesis